jgi:broad specificity phosphatase PhoE
MDFLKYLSEHAPDLMDEVEEEMGKDMTAGDVHVSSAGGDGKKPKRKKPVPPISVVYNPEKGFFETERFGISEAGPVEVLRAELEKLKLKHSVKLDATPAELKALTDALNKDPVLRTALQSALAAATGVGKAATKDLMVIRHGATHLNNNDTSVDRVRGWKDVPLSQEGKKEAAKLAEKVSKEPPDHLVTSDLRRAHDTAKMVAAVSGIKVDDVSKAFRPWNVGKFAGVTSKEAVPILCRYAVDMPDDPVPEGESFNTFRSRFFKGLSDACKKYPGVLGVVTHHRGERLLKAWQAAGYPDDGSIDAKTFTKKGETTAGYETIEVPLDKLHSAAEAKVTKFLGTIDYDNVFEEWPLVKREFSEGERQDAADSGAALPDGSFPIKNEQDLRNAIHAIGRAKNPAKAKAHIRTRARALGASDLIPESWGKRMGPLDGEGEEVEKTFTVDVEKMDAEQQILYGWAYVSEENGQVLIDKQDDYILAGDLLKAAEEFTLHGGKLGDMHQDRNVGRVVASFVTSKELCKAFNLQSTNDRVGWIIGFKVDDPAVWAKIKGGMQLELSIGGRAMRVQE